jgi:hypothetical protein
MPGTIAAAATAGRWGFSMNFATAAASSFGPAARFTGFDAVASETAQAVAMAATVAQAKTLIRSFVI